MKIPPMKELIAEMRRVARGEIPAPIDAAEPTVESVEARDVETRPPPTGCSRAAGPD